MPRSHNTSTPMNSSEQIRLRTAILNSVWFKHVGRIEEDSCASLGGKRSPTGRAPNSVRKVMRQIVEDGYAVLEESRTLKNETKWVLRKILD